MLKLLISTLMSTKPYIGLEQVTVLSVLFPCCSQQPLLIFGLLASKVQTVATPLTRQKSSEKTTVQRCQNLNKYINVSPKIKRSNFKFISQSSCQKSVLFIKPTFEKLGNILNFVKDRIFQKKRQYFKRFWKYFITKPENSVSDTQSSSLSLTIFTTCFQLKYKPRFENC